MATALAARPLFFYGSLQDRALLALVTGRPDPETLALRTAALADHDVERAEGYVFPMIVQAPNRTAPGAVIDGLDATERARIAFFEDSDYALRGGDAIVDGAVRPVAFFAPTAKLRSSGEPWRIEAWPKADRALLMACAEEQLSYFGVHPQAVVETWWPEIEARARSRLTRTGDGTPPNRV